MFEAMLMTHLVRSIVSAYHFALYSMCVFKGISVGTNFVTIGTYGGLRCRVEQKARINR